MNQVPLKLNLEDGGTLENAVYRTLKRAVYYGYLPPGERLVESTLARKLNVGRTPLREAIKRLSAEGLLNIVPNKGATVVRLSPGDVEELYLIRGILEGVAAAIAVERLGTKEIQTFRKLHDEMKDVKLQENLVEWMKVNDRFHHIYLKACQKPILLRMIKDVTNPLHLYWYRTSLFPSLLEMVVMKHGAMVDAFENRDAELARRATEDHSTTIGQQVKKHLENIPGLL